MNQLNKSEANYYFTITSPFIQLFYTFTKYTSLTLIQVKMDISNLKMIPLF